MTIPNLNRIVDTYIPAATNDFDLYCQQLRTDVVPHIRNLQSEGVVRWYCFLLHGADQLSDRDLADSGAYIHLFLEPEIGMEFSQFVSRLPSHFLKPTARPLSTFSGVDGAALRDGNWAYAWKGIGDASEFVLRLLENHGENALPIPNVIQFLHFITNPLRLGQQFLFIPGGFIRF